MSKEKYLKIEEKLETGFDRGVDYSTMKQKLIDTYKSQLKAIEDDKLLSAYDRRVLLNKQLYCITAMIQLCNGSRILEACKAIKLFFKNKNFDEKILVKLAKSECTKTNDEGEEYTTKARFRKMKFPSTWIEFQLTDSLTDALDKIKIRNLKQRVLDWLHKYHDCNTHSLRYAFINFMLYKKKQEMGVVAKFVGHSNLNQLVRYSQQIQAEKMFLLDDDD